MSKIRIESESQQGSCDEMVILSCLSWCQRYELKANHNHIGRAVIPQLLFIVMSKIRIESESQLIMLQMYKNTCCLSWCQRYELKANHNISFRNRLEMNVVYRDVKDTNWKRITTKKVNDFSLLLLFIVMSKIRIESESQHLQTSFCWNVSCLSWCQRYELKANHNMLFSSEFLLLVVCRDVKDTNWKRIIPCLRNQSYELRNAPRRNKSGLMLTESCLNNQPQASLFVLCTQA